MMTMTNRTVAAVAGLCMAVAGVLAASPANAAPTTTVTAAAPSGSAAGATTAGLPVHTDYAAGKYYYVCVNGDGRTWTVPKGTAVATSCRGANAVQQFLESGQHVWTHSLTASGKRGTFKGGADCYVAIGATAFAVLTFEDSWIWYAGTSATAYGLHACKG